MSFYRTLVPLSYVEGNQVITVKTPGTRIDLTPVQAAALQGQIVIDETNEHTYPRVDVLKYEWFVQFPDQGLDAPLYFANDTGLLYRWDPVTLSYVAIGVPTNWDSIDTDARDDLVVGESTMSRRYITSDWISPAGTMTLGYFTARKTEQVSQVRTISGGQGQVGATLQRIAVYQVDDANNLSLVASSSSDSSLWSSADTAYTESFSASFVKIRGQRYAVGVLSVGASTAPSFLGTGINAAEAFISPMLSAKVTGLSDLPSTVLSANLAASFLVPYCVLLP